MTAQDGGWRIEEGDDQPYALGALAILLKRAESAGIGSARLVEDISRAFAGECRRNEAFKAIMLAAREKETK